MCCAVPHIEHQSGAVPLLSTGSRRSVLCGLCTWACSSVIFVLTETVTSFTSTMLLSDERHESLCDALIQLCIHMCPMDGSLAIVRTDPAPGFKAPVNNGFLQQHGIILELGCAKNINKNPVAEKAIQELEDELLRLDPLGGAVTPLTLAIATAALNSHIRSRGLSSREMWTQ